MKSIILSMMCCLITVFAAEAQYTFPACGTPWIAGTYVQGNQVSHNSANYQAKYYTTAEPGTNGDWALVSKCGDGGIGADYTGPQRIVGYLPYWVPNFNYANFDPGTVTQINVAFNLFKQNNNDFNSANFASIAWGEFHNHKVDSILFDLGVLSRAKAKGTKVSVAIGGSTDYAFLWLMTKYYNDDAKLEEIATFITNYVNTKNIDGIDLDLECWWPDATISGTVEQGGRVRGDKYGGPDAGPSPAAIGLTKLAQKLRQKMPNKILSAAVFATSYYGNNYDDAMAQYLDFIGLMTYDFTGSWTASPVGPHSSLYKVPLATYQGQSADNPIYSAQDALEYWMGMAAPAWNHDGGFNVPKAKLCIGVPFYGYDLATHKPNNANGFVALKWNEIVAAYPNAANSYDPLDTRQLGGYIGADGKKIYYETPKGAGAKIKYTKQFGHQGVILWELSGDTPYGGGSSLLKAINDAAGVVVNPPPTVAITSPVNNATFTTGSAITIAATATDNVSVSKVDFYNGSTLLGTDTSSPYSFSWTSVAAGTYALTAKATDNQNATGVSAVINITVGNSNPTATITTPANNATYTAPATVNITATATDTDGTITKVDFYNGTTLLGTDTSSPYTFSWTNVAAGTYAITAKATDNGTGTGTSAVVTVKVNAPGNVNPTATITTPANNATYTAPATVNIAATATDTDGTITKVDFYNGTTLLGTDTSSPYSFSWTSVAAGTYTLTAKATDNATGTGTSAVVTVTVNAPGNINPTATITTPANNATYTAPATVNITATATDTDGTITKVDFYNGTTLLGTDTSSPYTFSWTSVAAGTYTLTAKATDNATGTGTSAAVTVTVNAPGNINPTATITAPANNATYTAPATVNITATATDTDGTITKVDFYNGTTLLGTDTSSPYSFSWTNVAAGTYGLTAKATDNTNGTGTSTVINITVNASGGGSCATIPQYVTSGVTYQPGNIVKNVGSQYECKPWPYSGWCSAAPAAYAPGTGTNWTDAWILKGVCSSGGRSFQDATENNPLIESEDVLLYPNPGEHGKENAVTLVFEKNAGDVHVHLINTNGTVVFINKFKNVKTTLNVSMPSLSNGFYFIRIQGESNRWIKKYVVN